MAIGNVDGPPPAHTGGFGEPTCHACHFDGPLNPPTGTLRLDGLPAGYEPGTTYRLELRLLHPDLRRAGFQLAVRHGDGPDKGTQAGTLAPAEDGLSLTRLDGIDYAHHLRPATRPATPGSARWLLDWTAPNRHLPATVVFHAAANAANDDDSEFGDVILTLEQAVPPAAVHPPAFPPAVAGPPEPR